MTVGDLSNLYLRVEKDKYWYMDNELYNSVVDAVDKGYCRILNTKSPDKFMSAYNFWSYLHEKLLERDEYTPSYKKVHDSFDSADYKFEPLYKQISKFRAVCTVVFKGLILPVVLMILAFTFGDIFPRFAVIMAISMIVFAYAFVHTLVRLFQFFITGSYALYKDFFIDYDVDENKFYRYKQVSVAYKNMVLERDKVLSILCKQCDENVETRLTPCNECKSAISLYLSPFSRERGIDDFELCRFERKNFSNWYNNA